MVDINNWCAWCVIFCLPKCFPMLSHLVSATRNGTGTRLRNYFHFAAEKRKAWRVSLAEQLSTRAEVLEGKPSPTSCKGSATGPPPSLAPAGATEHLKGCWGLRCAQSPPPCLHGVHASTPWGLKQWNIYLVIRPCPSDQMATLACVEFGFLVMSNSLWLHGLQYARLPCPSPTPGDYLNSCPSMPCKHLILCHPLILPPSIFPSIRVFSWVSSLHHVATVLEFQLQHQSFQWTFRTDFL